MYKSKLQEYCQSKAWHLPVYSTTKVGLDHCPQFKATVTLNGSTFSTPDFYKSSKEAQNNVAKLAFEHLTGSLGGDSKLPGVPASSAVQQPKTNETLQAAFMGGLNSPSNDKNFKDLVKKSVDAGCDENRRKLPQVCQVFGIRDEKFEMANLYKNQLQIYAQKRNLPLPVYTCEREGPPHACRFRSKVTIEEKIYESPEYFSTVKDAENAVAKVALMTLSSAGIQEEDPTVFKNLLQELAQKEYSCLPEYNTTWTGASHTPMFVSTVAINEESFTGEEAKTKKLAEMNAAKVAYASLKERQVKQKSEPHCSGSQVKDASKSSFPQIQSIVMPELPQRVCPDPKLSCHKSNGEYQKATRSETVKVGFNVSQDGSCQESQCSIIAPVRPTSLFDPITYIEPWTETNTLSSQKIVKIFPRLPNMTFPPGTTIYRENEKWVAVTRKPVSRQ